MELSTVRERKEATQLQPLGDQAGACLSFVQRLCFIAKTAFVQRSLQKQASK